MNPTKFLSVVIALLFCQLTVAQVSTRDTLFVALKAADSLVFDLAFNQCRLDVLERIIHPDLEFLHDKGGIQNREKFLKGFKESICSNPDIKPIRKLVEGSLEVYPLFDSGKLYGAIQMGEHKFYLAVPGKELRHTSSAKFTHTWLLTKAGWQLYRVLSYDHQEPK